MVDGNTFGDRKEGTYKKILGLQQLERMGFPVPPYVIIDVKENEHSNLKRYILEKINLIGVPCEEGDRVGVTIRVSVPGELDKTARHGGLHVTDIDEVIKRVIAKYNEYKPYGKVIIQHTVDAKASGTILKERNYATVEVVVGDAPRLLEGRTTNYERWIFDLNSGKWNKDKNYIFDSKIKTILNPEELRKLEKYIKVLPNGVYLEWSLSKNGKLYFYEYTRLSGI